MRCPQTLTVLTALAAVISDVTAHVSNAVAEPRRAKAWHRAVVAANGVTTTTAGSASTFTAPALFEAKATSTSVFTTSSMQPSTTPITTSSTSSQTSSSAFKDSSLTSRTSLSSSQATSSSSTPGSTTTSTPASSSTSSPSSTTSTSSSSVSTSSSLPSSCKAVPAKNGPSIWDLDTCCIPTVADVPIFTIPQDPHDSSRPYPQNNAVLWHALNMDAWIDQLVTVCPHVKGTWCGGSLCDASQILSRLLVGIVPGQDGGWSSMRCDDNGCTWDEMSNSNRGHTWGPGTIPTLSLNATPEEVYNYRRWFLLKSVQYVWGHFKDMKDIVNVVSLIQSDKLAKVVNTLDPDKKITPASGLFDTIIDLVAAVASFTPVGPFVDAGVAGIEALEQISKQGWTAGLSAKQIGDFGSKFGTAMTSNWALTGKVAKYAAKDTQAVAAIFNSNNNDKITYTPKVDTTYANLGSALGDLFQQMQKGLAQASYSAVTGDLLAVNGLLNCVKGGVYASGTGFSPSPDDPNSKQAMGGRYLQWLTDVVVMNIFKAKGLYLWRDGSYASIQDCQNGPNYLQNWPGTSCMTTTQSGQGFDYFAPLTPSSWASTSDWAGDTSDIYSNDLPSLQDATLAQLDGGSGWLTLQNIYQRSLDCAQTSWSQLSANPLKCTGMHVWGNSHMSQGTISSPLQGLQWTAEVQQFGNDPAKALCHFNIPIVDTTRPEIRQGAWNSWMSARPYMYGAQGPSWEDGSVWLVEKGKPGYGFRFSQSVANPNDPCSCGGDFLGWQTCKSTNQWFYDSNWSPGGTR